MSRMNTTSWTLAFVILALTVFASTSTAEETRPPNVILILIDDMGFTDLGCAGSKFYDTPHIDRLAASGMRLTHGYSACTVCSPTRAAVMTGKYPARLHITDWISGSVRPFAKLKIPEWTQHLPHEEITIAEVFRSAGYATCHIGKWHLGGEEFGPTTQGFDQNFGGNHRGQPPSYFFPYETAAIKLPGLAEGKPGDYLTDRLTDEALAFIAANQNKPFFLYLPHYTVHTPLQAKAELIEKYQAKAQLDAPHKNPVYAAMIESLDQGIGRILDQLEKLKLRENTIVVFTSDNGGLLSSTSNPPARAGKGSAYEGGVRVPWIVSHPATIKAGTTSSAPVMSIDLFPTLAELCELTLKEVPQWDGIDITPVLQGGEIEREAIYWHYPHYHPGGATPYSAVRSGDWRLVEFFEDNRVELYNLKDDIREQHDLADSQPKQRDQLLAQLRTWRKEVGAQLPTPNSEYDPVKNGNKAKKSAR